MSASTHQSEGCRTTLRGSTHAVMHSVTDLGFACKPSPLRNELLPDNGNVMAEIAGERLWVTLKDGVIIEMVNTEHPDPVRTTDPRPMPQRVADLEDSGDDYNPQFEPGSSTQSAA